MDGAMRGCGDAKRKDREILQFQIAEFACLPVGREFRVLES
jgi:hypothetical protein